MYLVCCFVENELLSCSRTPSIHSSYRCPGGTITNEHSFFLDNFHSAGSHEDLLTLSKGDIDNTLCRGL